MTSHESPEPVPPPHRLRDLDRRGRLFALAFALALALAPVQAYRSVVDDWTPHGDPARIALQTLEVGGRSTPLTGQPSSSGLYVESERHVDHPGALHYYLMAGPVRALGIHTGMLATSVVIVSTCALLSAWAAFRRLGPSGGVAASIVIGLIMFTTGAPSLMTPLNSNTAGYPLFCAAVLLWCVLRGDLRLLPVTAAVTTFAAQQHLSVLPTLAVVTPVALVGLGWHWGHDGRWRTREARRQLARWSALTVVVSLVLWSPMLFQETTNDPGNLSSLVELAGDDERPTAGLDSAVRQVTNVLGLPPLLGSTDLATISAGRILQPPPLLTKVSALMVLGLLGGLAVGWRDNPERRSLVVMAGVLVLAGLYNGSSVLESVESFRMVLYHWIWPLTFFVVTALLLGAGEALRAAATRITRTWPERVDAARTRVPGVLTAYAGTGALAVAVLAAAVPAAVGTAMDRPSNDLASFRAVVERRHLDELTEQVAAHRDELDGPFLVFERGASQFGGTREAAVLSLVDAGLDARMDLDEQHYVANRRIAWPGDEINSALLIRQDHTPDWQEATEGELIADVLTVDEDWPAAAEAMAGELGAGPIRFGPGIAEALDRIPPEWVVLAEQGHLREVMGDLDIRRPLATPEEARQLDILRGLDELHRDPTQALRGSALAEFLLDHPLDRPRLSAETVDRVRASLPEGHPATRPIRLRVYRLTPEELNRHLPPEEQYAVAPDDSEDSEG